jgi:hypothetical protein
MCSGMVGSSCTTSGIRRVNLDTSSVTSREWGKDRKVFTTSRTYPWSFVTLIFHNGQPSHDSDVKCSGKCVFGIKKECSNGVLCLCCVVRAVESTVYITYIIYYPELVISLFNVVQVQFTASVLFNQILTTSLHNVWIIFTIWIMT